MVENNLMNALNNSLLNLVPDVKLSPGVYPLNLTTLGSESNQIDLDVLALSNSTLSHFYDNILESEIISNFSLNEKAIEKLTNSSWLNLSILGQKMNNSVGEVMADIYDSIILNQTEQEGFDVVNDTNGNKMLLSFSSRPKWHSILDKIITYIMMVNIVNIMFGMGCAIYVKEVIQNLWPPVGIAIGMIGQFIIIPLLGFCMSILFGLESYIALGCLIVTCSPGGTFSNFYTFWLEGDLALSILMTSCSALLAFIGMPFNLWMYSSYYIGEGSNDIVIPYMNILKTLAIIGVPVFLGILIRHFNEKIATLIVKFTTKFALFLFVVVISCWTILYWKVFGVASPYVYACAIVLPLTCCSAAYFVAFICKRSRKVCRTIAIETGCQNMTVAMSIVLLSFDEPEIRAQMLLFPSLYGIFLMTEMITVIVVFKATKLRRGKTQKQYPDSSQTVIAEIGTDAEKENIILQSQLRL